MTNLALSTVSVAFLLFAWGGVVFAVLFKDYFGRTLGQLFRPEAEIKLAWVGIEKLGQALLLGILYLHFERFAPSGAINGLAFGALVGALLQVTYFFSTWVNYRVPFAPIALIAVVDWLRYLAAGLILGAILG